VIGPDDTCPWKAYLAPAADGGIRVFTAIPVSGISFNSRAADRGVKYNAAFWHRSSRLILLNQNSLNQPLPPHIVHSVTFNDIEQLSLLE
jgi:hypothetical protein